MSVREESIVSKRVFIHFLVVARDHCILSKTKYFAVFFMLRSVNEDERIKLNLRPFKELFIISFLLLSDRLRIAIDFAWKDNNPIQLMNVARQSLCICLEHA
jgi:hypothetical protein